MNENKLNIKEKVIKVFAKITRFKESEISESTSLRSSIFKKNDNCLGLDFIEETMAVCGLEKAFNINLPDDFMDDFKNVGDVINNVKKAIQR